MAETNPFDEFDAPKQPANPFDEFDSPASKPPQTTGQKLMETWPAKAAQSIWSGVTAPGDVATGKFDVKPSGPPDAHGNPTWTDEDEARRQMNDAAAVDRAKELAT